MTMALALRVFLKSCVSVVPALVAIFLSFNVNADWVSTANGYECTSGTCDFFCDVANECEDQTFIASHSATKATITCSGENSCLDTVFYLAASNDNGITCLGLNSCKNAEINVGVPDSGVITAPVPNTFLQSDFFGLIQEFSLSCLDDSTCVDMNIVSYYEIADQDIFCMGGDATNSCNNVNINAQSTEGDISITCEKSTSCTAVAFTTAAPTAGCIGTFCSPGVTHLSNPAPTPDLDADGVLDAEDLCPLGMSSITDVNTDGCDDGLETPDTDGDGVSDLLDGRILEWSGPIFFGDFFNEANWEDNGGVTAADVVNPSQVIGREIIMSNIAVNLPDNTDIFLGLGNSLTVNSGTLGAGVNTNFHPLSVGGGGSASILVKSTTNFNFGLAWDIAFRLEGSGRIISANSDFDSDTGVLGKTTTVDFVGGKTRAMFSNISVSNAETMLAKFSVDGATAVLNDNIIIKANGELGSMLLPDFDGDGIGGHEDNCPFSVVVNTDFDGDGCDDVVEDADDDADGVIDDFDQCVTEDFNLSADFDADGCDDANEDLDDDNDGKLDSEGDVCLTEDGHLSIDFDDDGCDDADEDTDLDNDGVPNSLDQCFTADFHLSADLDGDGCDDADEDKDDDNDGALDTEDAFPNDPERSKKKKSPDSGSLFYLLALSMYVLRKRHSKSMHDCSF